MTRAPNIGVQRTSAGGFAAALAADAQSLGAAETRRCS
jgi:hypothetical protein